MDHTKSLVLCRSQPPSSQGSLDDIIQCVSSVIGRDLPRDKSPMVLFDDGPRYSIMATEYAVFIVDTSRMYLVQTFSLESMALNSRVQEEDLLRNHSSDLGLTESFLDLTVVTWKAGRYIQDSSEPPGFKMAGSGAYFYYLQKIGKYINYWAVRSPPGIRDVYVSEKDTHRFIWFLQGKELRRILADDPTTYQVIYINGLNLPITGMCIRNDRVLVIYVDPSDDPINGGLYDIDISTEGPVGHFGSDISFDPNIDLGLDGMNNELFDSNNRSRIMTQCADTSELYAKISLPEKEFLIHGNVELGYSVETIEKDSTTAVSQIDTSGYYFIGKPQPNNNWDITKSSVFSPDIIASGSSRLEPGFLRGFSQIIDTNAGKQLFVSTAFQGEYFNLNIEEGEIQKTWISLTGDKSYFDDDPEHPYSTRFVIESMFTCEPSGNQFLVIKRDASSFVIQADAFFGNVDEIYIWTPQEPLNMQSIADSGIPGSNDIKSMANGKYYCSDSRWISFHDQGNGLVMTGDTVQDIQVQSINYTIQSTEFSLDYGYDYNFRMTPGQEFLEVNDTFSGVFKYQGQAFEWDVAGGTFNDGPSIGVSPYSNYILWSYHHPEQNITYFTQSEIDGTQFYLSLLSENGTQDHVLIDEKNCRFGSGTVYLDMLYVTCQHFIYRINITDPWDLSSQSPPYEQKYTLTERQEIYDMHLFYQNVALLVARSGFIAFQLVCPEELSNNSTYCLLCGVHEYRSWETNACEECPPGHYALYHRDCRQCSPGTEPSPLYEYCLYCPYNEAGTNGTCAPCSHPNEIPDDDNLECIRCVDQTPASVPVEDPTSLPPTLSCQYCGDGYIAAGDSCQLCPNNTIPDPFQGTECLSCPDGSVIDAQTGVCDPCPSGERSDLFQCVPCPPGTEPYAPNTTCQACPSGQFSIGNNDLCQRCDFYSFTNDSISCYPCPPNEFNLNDGESCAPCPFAQVPDAADFQCELCDIFSFTNDSMSCWPCPDGQYQSSNGTGCQSCPFGRILNVYNSTLIQCEACPFGEIAAMNGTTCIECPRGEIAVNGTACYSCDADRIAVEDQNECQLCGIGHVPDDDQHRCVECPSNAIVRNGVACEICDEGMEPNTNRTECIRIDIDVSSSSITISGSDSSSVSSTVNNNCQEDCGVLGMVCNRERSQCECPPGSFGKRCQASESDRRTTRTVNRIAFPASIAASGAATGVSATSSIVAASQSVSPIVQPISSLLSGLFGDFQFSAFVGSFQVFSNKEFEQFSSFFSFSLFLLPVDVSSSSSSSENSTNATDSNLYLASTIATNTTAPAASSPSPSSSSSSTNNNLFGFNDQWLVISALLGVVVVYALVFLVHALVALVYIRSLRVPKNRRKFMRNYLNNNIRMALIVIPGLSYFSIYHLSLGQGTFQIVISSLIAFCCLAFNIIMTLVLFIHRNRLHNKTFREKCGSLYDMYRDSRWFFGIVTLSYRSFIGIAAAVSAANAVTGLTLAIIAAVAYTVALSVLLPFRRRSRTWVYTAGAGMEAVVLMLGVMVLREMEPTSAMATGHGAVTLTLCILKMMMTISYEVGMLFRELWQRKKNKDKNMLVHQKENNNNNNNNNNNIDTKKQMNNNENNNIDSDDEMEEMEKIDIDPQQ